MKQSSTLTLIAAALQLSDDIQSPDDVPQLALREIAARLSELNGLLEDVYPLVKAKNGAEHMMDGFGGRSEQPSDLLVARFERLLAK